MEELNSHSVSKHCKSKPVKSQIPDCSTSFASQGSTHNKAFHSSAKFRCEIAGCEREFSAMKYLKVHREAHHIDQTNVYDEQIRARMLMIQMLSREVEQLSLFRRRLLELYCEDELTADDIPSVRPDDMPNLNDSFGSHQDSSNDKET